MDKILPLFTTHYSKCDSILTLDGDVYKKDEKGNKTNEVIIDGERPVSLFAVARVHGLKELFITDNSLAGFWEAYKNAKEFGIPCYFGMKLVVCDDLKGKDDKDTSSSRDTESTVIIFLKNSEAYKDAIKLYSKAAVDGFYYQPRLDWKTLNELWTPNLMLALPFYSSFLARNLLMFGRSIQPDIEKLNPTFFLESHDLPFDGLLKETVLNYAKETGFTVQPTHSIYYYKTVDHLAYQVLKCIDNRTTLMKPELSHHGSDQFSFESYQQLCQP